MLTVKHIRDLAIFYLVYSVVCFAWFAWYELTLFQQAPVFFLNKADISGNLFLATGITDGIISSPVLRLVLDSLFFLLPFFLFAAVRKKSRFTVALSVISVVYNMLYAYLFSIFTFVSIEVFTAWLFVPFVFASKNIRTNYYLLHCVRLIFLVIFFSTALWKIRNGGLFNVDQFSAVLLRQHASLLVSDPSFWFSRILIFIIGHPILSYSLYLLAFALEFIFVVGFFTKRYDRFLMACFFGFLIFDYFLMEINYFPWLPFLGILYYSRFNEPLENPIV